MKTLNKIIIATVLFCGLVGCSGNESKIINTEEYEVDGFTCIRAMSKDHTEFEFAVLKEDPNAVEVRKVDLTLEYGDPSAREVVIPQCFTSNKVKYEVKRIGDRAFRGRGITGIIMPSSIIEIGEEAFENCTKLTSLSIPNNVKNISRHAFCGSGLKSISIPNSVTSIGENAFGGCNALRNVSLPNSLTTISEGVFYKCDSLETISIPQNVKSIGDGAFQECNNLVSVNLPDGVTEIGESAFYHCSNLTSINIPNSVISIGDYAFAYCNNLASVIIPNSVTNIGENSFKAVPNIICETATEENSWGALSVNGFVDGFFVYNDESKNILKSYITNKDSLITIPDNVKIIGDNAFIGCEKLITANIPSSVTSIGNNAFEACENLSSINFQGSGLTSIGDEAFKGCLELTTVMIPSSVTNIGFAAFENCINLNSVTIPDGITRISENLFLGCNNITSITIPNTVTEIESGAFEDCENLTTITIPNSVTKIGTRAFARCGINSVTIPNNVSIIDDYAFLGCPNLTSVIIQNPNLELRYNIFAHCDNLQPQNVVYQTDGDNAEGQQVYPDANYDSPSDPTNANRHNNGGNKDVVYNGTNDLSNIDAGNYRFSENDLMSLSARDLTYLRNSVYAKHGYVFKSQELNNYFKQFGWYHPNPNVTDAALNSTEKANVEFIRHYQEQTGKTYKPQ